MKLISWNCQGAFRKKANVILVQRPDILVVQECEHPDKLIYSTTNILPQDQLWVGDNLHKGLGIFSYSIYRFQLHKKHNKDIKYVLPISVVGGECNFTLFAIWANNKQDPDGQYVEQVWKAIYYYDKLLNKAPSILIGDFNSNKIWDRPRRIGNHSAVVEKLAQKQIYSVYHTHLLQEQGKEKHATFYLYRNKKKSYHLDYCFTSLSLFEKVKSMKIGSYNSWIAHSDHSPLIIEFAL